MLLEMVLRQRSGIGIEIVEENRDRAVNCYEDLDPCSLGVPTVACIHVGSKAAGRRLEHTATLYDQNRPALGRELYLVRNLSH